jgi:LAO/AO transport system kinase
VPDAGDSIQILKAGIMEIADIFVVNKSDLAGVDRLVNNLDMMLDLKKGQGNWQIPVLKCRADEDEGVSGLLDKILQHKGMLEEGGQLEEKRGRQRLQQFEQMLEQKIMAEIKSSILHSDMINELEKKIGNGEISPYTALNRVMESGISSVLINKQRTSRDKRSK